MQAGCKTQPLAAVPSVAANGDAARMEIRQANEHRSQTDTRDDARHAGDGRPGRDARQHLQPVAMRDVDQEPLIRLLHVRR